MRVAVLWGGGKDSYTAFHKAVEEGHDVACLLTFVYTEPYIFHSFLIMELQSKALGVPLLKVKVKDPLQDIFEVLARLKKEEGIEAIVTGDIIGAGCARIHQMYYEAICEKLGIKLVMPLENPSKNTYDVLKEEISMGLKPMITCINLDYFDENWLGRELNIHSIKELKKWVDKYGIDVCSADGRGYHTMVIDSPLFREIVEISKFKKGIIKECRRWGERSWLYMDIKEAMLRPKK